MHTPPRVTAIVVAAAALLLAGAPASSQVTSGTDRDVSRMAGGENECAIAKNPSNALQLFIACNTTGPGLFAARSTDGGTTWIFPDPADKTIADGDAGQGPAACCDPTVTWDSFGNLYLTYIDAGPTSIVTLRSTDGGSTFTTLATFGPATVDQPTIVSANTSAAGAPVAVWVVWNQGGQMVARGAAVTGLGGAVAFGATQIIPGTANCSFGDVAIAPSGAVVQACGSPTGGQGPSTIRVNTDADGLGPGNFGASVTATTTNVGGFDFIPAQNARSIDPEAGLAFDPASGSPHVGRLYLVYTDETVAENNDTDIMLRFSDDNGATWSAPMRVNDDPAAPIRSQFLPRIAVNAASGDIGVCWHDARNSATNVAMREFCTIARPTGATPTFLANAAVSDGQSTSPGGMDFGDYSGLAYALGGAHPAWGDASNSTGNNPNGTANLDAMTDNVGRREFESICVTRPGLCPIVPMKPGIIVIKCVVTPCIVRDPIPRNCLVKFECPGCPTGALCPPWYTFELGYVDPAWQVNVFDPRGLPVAVQRRSGPNNGTLISFRPSRQYFKNGKIGDYFFTFETKDRAQAGREQQVRMSLRSGNQPFAGEVTSAAKR